jgi:glycerol-3-phosphate dehydrogenase
MNAEERNFYRVRNELYDILVIGGGINGAGIARDAALRGFKVCLIEKNDFASGTSSRSSKLVHGGLRYLEHGHFNLVREALQERHHLLNIAPHLVRPLPFIFPVYKTSPRGSLAVNIGLTLYDTLAGRRNIDTHEKLLPKEINQFAPGIQTKGFKNGFIYYDAKMNDARLCLENILDACQLGADCFNYVQALRLLKKEDQICGVQAQDLLTAQNFEIQARWVINATGPWMNDFLRMHSQNQASKIRLTKGIHILVPRILENHALILTTTEDGRVFFCTPWGPYSLVGTTDTDYQDHPDHVLADEKDVAYLLKALREYFPKSPFEIKDIVATYAGLRPLVQQEGKPSQVSREYKIDESMPGMFNVLGGKFTTYRSLSETVVDLASKKLKLYQNVKCQTHVRKLPGAAQEISMDEILREYELEPESAQHLLRTYGCSASEILRLAKEIGLKGRLCPHHPHLKSEVIYAFNSEMAQSLTDFFVRRSHIRFTSCQGIQCLDTVSKILEELELLSADMLEEQKSEYLAQIQKEKQSAGLIF